ncbi:PREDICTED: SNW/SKI-interacting protein-like [Tarenaya hassleriana]|uniref:SNW/SKI-interacting protein-like n=1 Tax=Tarenaya hassleriana TaxID=28532 RepID=UPI00053C5B8C|nr:PREDICTED: SNW/SKI-interacting protein-like [Tarenaya hassleriana]
MASLKDLLPPAKSTTSTFYDHSNDPWFKNRFTESESEKSAVVTAKPVPPYLKRQGFLPRKPEDFGDGGAFPEIHVAQYPLGMGRDRSNKAGSKTLPVTVDAQGNVVYDAIVKQNENSKKIVYSQHKDIIPKILKNEGDVDEDEDEELQKEIEETMEETKAALEKIVNVRLSAAQPNNVPKQSGDSKYIKYKPSQQSAAFNSGAKERIIRMVEMPVDPMEPPKFKHKRVPKASGSPPVPVMHSPPRPVTVKDQQDWKIPPCISNWKNPKGYTIPLDKRLAADGRGLQDVQINDNFAKLSEALYVAEQKAREAVTMRSKVQKEMMMKEKERKEQELRVLAQKARSERTGAAAPPAASMPVSSERGRSESVDPREDYDYDYDERKRDSGRGDFPKENREEREERLQREKIREERRRERERERRLEAKDAAMGKKSKITRDRDRDISEKVALGMASTGTRGGEVMYDQRLFNQDKGMDSGFATDDQYNVYDKGLFTAQPTLSTLYKPKKDMDEEMYGNADEQLEKLMKTDRFKPDKGFTGTSEKLGKRERPVEFEKEAEEADPFGLDQFLTEVKKGKRAMEKVGSGGTMRASGGSSRDDYGGGSGRSRIGFERGSGR